MWGRTILLDGLRARATGRVLAPTDTDFVTGVSGFNLTATHHPDAAVAVAQLARDLAPWRSPVSTINFAGEPPAEKLKDSWSAEIFARLQQVAGVYDPAALFSWRGNAV